MSKLEDKIYARLRVQQEKSIEFSIEEKMATIENKVLARLDAWISDKTEKLSEIAIMREQIHTIKKRESDLQNNLDTHKREMQQSFMNSQIVKYNDLARKINSSFRASTREPSQLRTFGNETLITNVRNINMRSPIFDAEKTKHPLQYLNSMKSYINASNLDHEEMLYVLSESLL